MFCPNCATEDRNNSQFCRVCGTELQTVRTALQRPDAITDSAVNAREEIGQAIAARIKELRTANDLKKIAEDVLPIVDKFLESPEEQRLRRYRDGVLTAATGMGIILFFLLLSAAVHGNNGEVLALVGAGAGLIPFLVGLGLIINAHWLSVLPQRTQSPHSISKAAISGKLSTGPISEELASTQPPSIESVTEGTTRQLE